MSQGVFAATLTLMLATLAASPAVAQQGAGSNVEMAPAPTIVTTGA
jgi:hypothetical protein